MKKSLIALVLLFFALLLPGLHFNLQRGLYWMDGFVRLSGENEFALSGGTRIAHLPDGSFALHSGGRSLTAQRSVADGGAVRYDFSDGAAVELAQDEMLSIVVDGMLLSGGAQYILTDMDALPLRFEPLGETLVFPILGEDGAPLGESVQRLSESGVIIDDREIWYDHPEWSSPVPRTIVLCDGVRLTREDVSGALLCNAAGEYLLDAQPLTMIALSGAAYDRAALGRLFDAVASGRTVRRGSIAFVLLFAVVYWIGAASLLFPEQAAFFGSRWKYNTEPELSEAGLFAMLAGSAGTILLSIVILFFGMSAP